MAGIKIYITKVSALFVFNAAHLRKTLATLCRRFKIRQAEISVVVVDDKTIKKINEEFLGRTSVTDVISFDLSDDKKHRVYELVVNAELAKRQAKKLAHNPEAELALYVVHGFLHNMGYDDAKKTDARRMHQMEDEILEEFGYGITFAQNTAGRIRKRD